MNVLRRLLNLIVSLLLIAGAIFVARELIAMREPLKTEPISAQPPLVETTTVSRGTVTVTLRSEGTVQAKQTLQLTSDVSGRVTWISPDFLTGEIVEAGQPLVRIDRTDYTLALAQAKLSLREAELNLADARSRFSSTSPDHPQLRRAQAQVEAAAEQLAKARQDLERTEISSPFRAVVDSKEVAIGQYVNVATPMGRLLATDVVEIPLPISVADLRLLNGDYRREVTLSARAADRELTWEGRITRVRRQLDTRTRIAYLVAEVEDPYGLEQPRPQPLRIGQFVHALIDLRVEGATRVPTTALFENRYVYTVDEHNRLQRRAVNILHRERNAVIVTGGLDEQSQIVLSRLDLMTDGMAVRIQAQGTD